MRLRQRNNDRAERRRATSRRAAIAVAAVLFADGPVGAQTDAQTAALCANPAETCGQLVAPACLSRAGAGQVPAVAPGGAAPTGCAAQLDAYAKCLQDVAARCDAGPAADDHAGGSSAEAEAALAALARPTLSPVMAQRCFSDFSRRALCAGGDSRLTLTLSSGSQEPSPFRGAALRLYALAPGGGAIALLADPSDQIDPAAVGSVTLNLSPPRLPRIMASCLRYAHKGETRGVLGAWRLTPTLPESAARAGGQNLYQFTAVAQPTTFDPAKVDCEAAIRDLAKRRGL